MPTVIDSYTSTSRAEIDTLKADAPFAVSRVSRSAYHIKVEGHTFEVAVREGGKNAVLDFNAPGRVPEYGISVEARDTAWPQSITSLKAKTGSFHLEMMDPGFFCMITPQSSFDFRIVSGPARAYIAVKEVSQGIEHLKGPEISREVGIDRKPPMPAAGPRSNRR